MAAEVLYPQKVNFACLYGTRKRDHDDNGTIFNDPCLKKPRVCNSSDIISGISASVDDQYETLNTISRGSYGIVRRAHDKKTGEIVAIKEEFDGFSQSSFREIEILTTLHEHPSIVGFRKVAYDDCEGVYVVMEYLETDLQKYIESKKDHKPFSPSEVKWLMKQILEGVKFLHGNEVWHRDLKPSNILMNNANESHDLKLCDFGFSRHFGSGLGSYTPNVGTLWYRAPELLLGAKTYSSAVDMWSVGCIMAELLMKEVIFRGESEMRQLLKIYGILGTPNEDVWPGFSSLPGSMIKFGSEPYGNILRDKVPASVLTEVGFDLLKKLLAYDPDKRITAEAALSHDWFKEE